jgi:hypothetical protein
VEVFGGLRYMNVKAGTMLLVSHGAYSSYERVGWFMVVQDFNTSDMLAAYLAERVEQSGSYRFKHSEFLAWVITRGVMVQVEEFFDEWHLGDYGQVDEISFLPRESRRNSDV